MGMTKSQIELLILCLKAEATTPGVPVEIDNIPNIDARTANSLIRHGLLDWAPDLGDLKSAETRFVKIKNFGGI